MWRRMLEVLFWWAAALGIWLVSLSAVSRQEYLIAGLCSLPCGVTASLARWAVEGAWPVRARWLSPLLLLPVAIVTDALQVLAAPWRAHPRAGELRTVATPAAGDSPSARARRAVAVALVSATPGTYVLDIDTASGDMLVHSLAPRGPKLEQKVAR